MNSNGVKSDAMYRSALGYGSEKAKRLVDYHVNNGGIGREIKFRWFLREIMGINEGLEDAVSDLKREYSKNLWGGLLTCEVAPGIREILAELRKEGVSLFVVSGADDDELRAILKERDLALMFDGIYGAPKSKDDILLQKIREGEMDLPRVFVGDSKYDYEVANRFSFDFIFAHNWSDFSDWEQYFYTKNHVKIVRDISEVFS